jgi:hypothetical protein
MNSNNDDIRNGSRRILPAMVMPSGQVVYWTQPDACQAYCRQAQSQPLNILSPTVKRAALLAAARVPLARLITRIVKF